MQSTTSDRDVAPGERSGPPEPVGPPPRRSSGRAWEWSLAGLLLAPNLVLLIVFTYRPLLDNIRLSFTDWNISAPVANPVGFANYVEWFGRDDTRTVLSNTLIFTVATVGISMGLGLALAMLLDQRLRGRNVVRSVVFAPFVISGAAVGVAFQFVFDPSFGLVRDLLTRVGVAVPDFYQRPGWALFMVTFTYIWKTLGYSFVIYLAALQGRRADLDEAAEIDGASPWTHFRRVLLPQLRPTTFFLSITVLLSSVQVFDIINVMTRGGPVGDGTMTLVYQVYRETFVNLRAGYGATVATVMFLILLVVTIVQVRVMDRPQT
ncbi:carbohydrate ABC transporter permease [Phycicoccus duodecadis]|uniref:Carbohydrate ABC transporter membrane protein 1 (CUT1 family) n=1 Tax=Phycicoccus duodecadis TaxID=173053 RepID=A0A2N3YNE3_9MICO|nr:sugar ABC transporter permease [Phycicoccus duodecadis]PKW25219.1 carbohydrate ABC transporter membrane protein 1 (CUT1 family) [Phycicoccus duodecadis]PKW28395.1 sn-glycerol 3-phosphate transport system permease protein [Phycicoccus duodecadis]PKW28398.1 carbohydrate ABC transporter membrane protein 1 (CUT1 family) [Phycicoccus duodecadis]